MTTTPPRVAPLDLSAEEFRRLGHRLVDDLAAHLSGIRTARVTTGARPAELRALLGGDRPLPALGMPADRLLADATRLVLEQSLYIGHPMFQGYVVGSPAPLGALGDLLASIIDPNVGGYVLAPIATEIERQSVRWIAELLGYDPDCGGLLVSGGNMANFVGFLAGRRAVLGPDFRKDGVAGAGRVAVYCTDETHTWIDKAADLFGHGADTVRKVPLDAHYRMDVAALRRMLREDRAAGLRPIMVIGNAGTVSTGAIDPLLEIAAVAREEGLWFHVDGAYGGFAAALPEATADHRALALADSIAIDPHKWLYAPIECGCALVRTPRHLLDTFSYRPPYYHIDEEDDVPPIFYFEYGLQNSRGFRALKVWLQLQQAGRAGYEAMIREDCRLARVLSEACAAHPDIETLAGGLSITTFRWAPTALRTGRPDDEARLNAFNTRLVERLQAEGRLFVSNAVVGGKYALRSCIVNFRTTEADVRAIPGLVAECAARLEGAQALTTGR
jgi:aromatic-L-amino-acid decarboxylase